jgi:hypothetical protein
MFFTLAKMAFLKHEDIEAALSLFVPSELSIFDDEPLVDSITLPLRCLGCQWLFPGPSSAR